MATGGLWLLWCTLPGLGVGRHFLGNTRPPWFRLVIDLSWQSGAAFYSPFLCLFSTVSSFFLVLSFSLFLSPQKAGCITVGWNATIGPGLLRSYFGLPLALFACLRHVYAARTMCSSASFVSDKKETSLSWVATFEVWSTTTYSFLQLNIWTIGLLDYTVKQNIRPSRIY